MQTIFRPDPVEDESLQWATEDDLNAAQEAAEERAYAAMDAHDAGWIEWLTDPVYGADGHDVARLLSLYLRADAATDAEKIERAALAMEVRASYCRHVEDQS